MFPTTFTQVQPDWLHPKLKSPYKLYRKHTDKGRFYFEYDGVSYHSFVSITNLASQVIPKGAEYEQWVAKLGLMSSIQRDKAATFGSLFHSLAMKPFRDNEGFDFDWLGALDEEGYINLRSLVPSGFKMYAEEWLEPMKKNLLCWFQFVKERVIDIVAIEIPLRSREWGLAATLDMVCHMKFYGKPKLTIIDLKSFMFDMDKKVNAKKKFFKAHQFQLEGCKAIWNATESFTKEFGMVEVIANFAPYNFRDYPKVDSMFKNQTKNPFSQKSDNVYPFLTAMKMARELEYNKAPTKVADITGSFTSIDKFDYSDHLITINLD